MCASPRPAAAAAEGEPGENAVARGSPPRKLFEGDEDPDPDAAAPCVAAVLVRTCRSAREHTVAARHALLRLPPESLGASCPSRVQPRAGTCLCTTTPHHTQARTHHTHRVTTQRPTMTWHRQSTGAPHPRHTSAPPSSSLPRLTYNLPACLTCALASGGRLAPAKKFLKNALLGTFQKPDFGHGAWCGF